MRILVTGATGFIGRFLIPLLVTMPDTAVTLLRLDAERDAPFPPELAPLRPHFDVVYADLRNFRLTARAVRAAAPECVIHLAAVGVTDPFMPVQAALRHNLTGTLHLLQAAFEKTRTTQRFITARTPGERSAMNVYAASKAAAWNFCAMYARTRQWPILGAMIFQAYGPGQPAQNLIPAAMQAALAGQDFPLTAGAQQRDWIYVTDIAAGLQALGTADLAPGATVELGTGRLTSVADVARRIYALVGGAGRPRVGALPSRPGETAVQVADATRTRALLGWETAVDLENGLRRVREYLEK